jgi:hypothetical protein
MTQYAKKQDKKQIIYLFYFAKKNVLFVEEKNAAGLVKKVVVHNLLEQVNAFSQPNTVHFNISYINTAKKVILFKFRCGNLVREEIPAVLLSFFFALTHPRCLVSLYW